MGRYWKGAGRLIRTDVQSYPAVVSAAPEQLQTPEAEPDGQAGATGPSAKKSICRCLVEAAHCKGCAVGGAEVGMWPWGQGTCSALESIGKPRPDPNPELGRGGPLKGDGVCERWVAHGYLGARVPIHILLEQVWPHPTLILVCNSVLSPISKHLPQAAEDAAESTRGQRH